MNRVHAQIGSKATAQAELPGDDHPLWGRIFLGDCLEVVRQVPGASLDLLYLDPPFFTRKDRTGRPRREADLPNGTCLSFQDRWQGGLHDYLEWLGTRIRALRRLLGPRGVFLLHLDWHAVHHAKVLCDQIFGMDHFQNELIWYYQTGGASKGRFSRKHDSLLLYANGDSFHFDGRAVAIPRTAKAMKRAQCPTGARIRATDTHKNPDDVLVIPALNPMAVERTGYPTQKPLALLEILIKALCPAQGAVGDFFCGSGTTLLAAQRLGRRWVGGDVSPDAVDMTRRRLSLAPTSMGGSVKA